MNILLFNKYEYHIMARLTIDTGTVGNPATGDTLRTAMTKVNSNFAEMMSGNLSLSGNSLVSVDTNGNIILDPNGTGQVQVNADRLVITTTKTATAIGNTGDVAGSISWDATNLYVCTADYDGSTVIWKKITLASI
jgi:filamentous hemagglutinin family protein|tara:strand:- start:56 stop:463 length:408 start_codon:yes stop_codon:yes gene_type:complete